MKGMMLRGIGNLVTRGGSFGSRYIFDSGFRAWGVQGVGEGWKLDRWFSSSSPSGAEAMSETPVPSSGGLIGALLDAQIQEFPAKDLLSFRSRKIRWNLTELKRHSAAVAVGLIELGLDSNSTVLSALGASPEHVSVGVGCGLVGIKVAQVSNGSISSESALKRMLKDTSCKVLIISHADAGAVLEAIPELKSQPKLLDSELELQEFPSLKYVVQTGRDAVPGMHRFKDVLVYYPDPSLFEGMKIPNGTDYIITIDGGSGSEKERFTIEQVVNIAHKADFAPDSDIVFSTTESSIAPLLTIGTIACASTFSKMVVPSEKPDFAKVEEAVAFEHCSAVIGDKPVSGLKSWTP